MEENENYGMNALPEPPAEGQNVLDRAGEVLDTALENLKADPNPPVNDKGEDGKNNAADQFAALPIEALIGAPFLAGAKAQQELNAVYIQNIMALAYKDGKAGGETNTLSMNLERPTVDQNGNLGKEKYTIDAPLLSLVPVPALMMDEITVDFNMEIKNTTSDESSTKTDVSSTVSYKSWFGLNASVTGSVSADSHHKRATDNTATYTIHARAIQQPPAEGMAKLTSLLSQAMEPIKGASS